MRGKLREGDARTERIIVSLRPEEQKAVQAAARDTREYPAVWCRRVLLAALRRNGWRPKGQ